MGGLAVVCYNTPMLVILCYNTPMLVILCYNTPMLVILCYNTPNYTYRDNPDLAWNCAIFIFEFFLLTLHYYE